MGPMEPVIGVDGNIEKVAQLPKKRGIQGTGLQVSGCRVQGGRQRTWEYVTWSTGARKKCRVKLKTVSPLTTDEEWESLWPAIAFCEDNWRGASFLGSTAGRRNEITISFCDVSPKVSPLDSSESIRTIVGRASEAFAQHLKCKFF